MNKGGLMDLQPYSVTRSVPEIDSEAGLLDMFSRKPVYGPALERGARTFLRAPYRIQNCPVYLPMLG